MSILYWTGAIIMALEAVLAVFFAAKKESSTETAISAVISLFINSGVAVLLVFAAVSA